MSTPPRDPSGDSRPDHLVAAVVAGRVCARCHRPLRTTNSPSQATPPSAARDVKSPPRVWVAVRTWPEGRICSGCFARACETYGVCPACGIHRLLPARRIDATGDHHPCCADCSPGVGDFTCTRCGQEGWHHYRGVCGRCVLGDRLAAHLDDGTGRVRPELAPLYDRIVAMPRPRTGILWLSKSHVGPILAALARGQVPLTHDGLSTLTPLRSVVHIRDLLMASGVLPARDRHLLLFEQWLDTWLADLQNDRGGDLTHGTTAAADAGEPPSSPKHVLRQYATWHVQRGLRKAADQGPIGHYRDQRARHQLRVAAQFLERLHARGLQLIQCSQSDVDAWFAAATYSSKETLRPFLVWAIRTHHMQRLRLPLAQQMPPRPISLHDRVEHLRRVANGLDMDLTERVIATLVLLYAQPLSRIVRLTVDDVLTDPEGRVLIRLGDPPAPIPPPFDDIVRSHLSSRHNLHTATNPNSTWLFPGRRAGQPIHPTSIRLRLTTLGIPNMPGRSRALREMLLQAPPAVVASMLGFHAGKAETIAAETGATWKRYAAGTHDRTRRPRLGS